MSYKDTFRLVWINAHAECIRFAFGRFFERDPKRAIEHVNAKLAEASRREGRIIHYVQSTL